MHLTSGSLPAAAQRTSRVMEGCRPLAGSPCLGKRYGHLKQDTSGEVGKHGAFWVRQGVVRRFCVDFQ